MAAQALPGFRDFYPEDYAFRAQLHRHWREVARRYGFEEYDGPPLEALDLYTRKSGEEIVGQLYGFEDKGGRAVALRPEMTPTLARMVAARANGLKKPIRWFAVPQLFRYERQQRGRLREHFQLNCDLIGEPGPLADAEIIALGIDVMRACGLGSADVRVRLSDRRVLAALLRGAGVAEEGLSTAYQAIDRAERMEPSAVEAMLVTAGFDAGTAGRILEAPRLKGRAEVESALARVEGGEAAGSALRATLDALEAMGFGGWIDLDLGIVRGLAYYTGTVFELFDAGRTLRAICGGGRYDDLLQSLGGVDLPAVGFGMGDVVLGELLKERGLDRREGQGLDAFVAAVTPDDVPHVMAAARELRDAGLAVEFALGGQPLGKQLKLADARAARFAVVIGPDDRARHEVQLKDLGSKSQRAVPRDGLVAALEARGQLHSPQR
jgi:histidyl-tRNA synthetase